MALLQRVVLVLLAGALSAFASAGAMGALKCDVDTGSVDGSGDFVDEAAYLQVRSQASDLSLLEETSRGGIIQVLCSTGSNVKANDCASCPPGFCHSRECEYLEDWHGNGGCTDNVASAPSTTTTLAPVHMYNCGGHYAPSCELCVKNGEENLGQSWCNGDCSWTGSSCILLAVPYAPSLVEEASRGGIIQVSAADNASED